MAATTILDYEKPMPTLNQLTNPHQNRCRSTAKVVGYTFNTKEQEIL